MDVGFDSAGGTPNVLVYAAGFIGVGLIGVGFIWAVVCYRTEQRRLARKKVVVLEARGLRDTSGAPLIEAVPQGWKGTGIKSLLICANGSRMARLSRRKPRLRI